MPDQETLNSIQAQMALADTAEVASVCMASFEGAFSFYYFFAYGHRPVATRQQGEQA